MNTTETTLSLVASALVEAIREGEVSGFRGGMRYCSEYLGAYMLPESDYLKLEELDVFSVVVGMAMGMACNEVSREHD